MRCLVALAVLGISSPALAHFRLIAPDNAYTQDSIGNPQLTSPCGGTGATVGSPSVFMTGATISVTLVETIAHPGHYRVALAPSMSMLPADPVINGAMCASAAIDPTPQLPVLVDGALQHTTMLSGDQTIQVTLPTTPCTDCVLQVIEFTANHAEPCFHYHCAMVTIAAPPMADAGVDAMPSDGGTNVDAAPGEDAAVGDDAGNGSAALTNPYANQGCATSGGSTGAVALLLAALAWRRRKKRSC